MLDRSKFIEFQLKLIENQINKYHDLAKIGIGPDASMNAKLVVYEVEELLAFLETMLQDYYNISNEILESIFTQTYFYIKQEHLRAFSGWLIDANNIHSPLLEFVQKQLSDLEEMAYAANIDISKTYQPDTSVQQQCEHDSHQIAFLILDKAIQLKNDPELDLGNQIPPHAQKIFRKHAHPNGRYHQAQIWEPMLRLHTQCQLFLSHSTLEKSTF